MQLTARSWRIHTINVSFSPGKSGGKTSAAVAKVVDGLENLRAVGWQRKSEKRKADSGRRTADRSECVADKQVSPLMFRGESSQSGQRLILGLRFGKLNLCITQMSSRSTKVMASLR